MFGGSPAQPEDEVKTIIFSRTISWRARSLVRAHWLVLFMRKLFVVCQALIGEAAQAAKIETSETYKDSLLFPFIRVPLLTLMARKKT